MVGKWRIELVHHIVGAIVHDHIRLAIRTSNVFVSSVRYESCAFLMLAIFSAGCRARMIRSTYQLLPENCFAAFAPIKVGVLPTHGCFLSVVVVVGEIESDFSGV